MTREQLFFGEDHKEETLTKWIDLLEAPQNIEGEVLDDVEVTMFKAIVTVNKKKRTGYYEIKNKKKSH